MNDESQEEYSKFKVFADKPDASEVSSIAVSLFKYTASHDSAAIYAASCCIWTMQRLIYKLHERGYGGAPLTLDEIVESLPPGPNHSVKIAEDNEDECNKEDDDDYEDCCEDEEETIAWLKARFRQNRRWPRPALEAAASAHGIENPLRLLVAAANLPILRTDAAIGKSGSYEVWIAKPGWPEEEKLTTTNIAKQIQEWITDRFLEKRCWSSEELYKVAEDDEMPVTGVWVVSQKLPIRKHRLFKDDGSFTWVWEAVEGWPEAVL